MNSPAGAPRLTTLLAVVRQETDRLLPIPDRFADIAALKAGMSPRPYRLVKSHEHAYIAT
jgi:hypothetical protein